MRPEARIIRRVIGVSGAVALAFMATIDTRTVAAADGPAVFVGSSIFRRWTNLAADMAPHPIVNRAFDGAMTPDMLRVLESLVVPARPKAIVYYCGSNDVAAGEPAEAIADRITQFFERASAALSSTGLVFVSIIRSPDKEERWGVIDEANRLVRAYASRSPRVEYVEVNHVLANVDGSPRVEFYMGDRLHLRPPAYEALARVLKPALARALGP